MLAVYFIVRINNDFDNDVNSLKYLSYYVMWLFEEASVVFFVSCFPESLIKLDAFSKN